MKKAIISSLKIMRMPIVAALVFTIGANLNVHAQNKWSEKESLRLNADTKLTSIAFLEDYSYMGSSIGVHYKETSSDERFVWTSRISTKPVEHMCSFESKLYFLERNTDQRLRLKVMERDPLYGNRHSLRDVRIPEIEGSNGPVRFSGLIVYKEKLYLAGYDMTDRNDIIQFLMVSEDGLNFVRKDMPKVAYAVDDEGNEVRAHQRIGAGTIQRLLPFKGKLILGCRNAIMQYDVATERYTELPT